MIPPVQNDEDEIDPPWGTTRGPDYTAGDGSVIAGAERDPPSEDDEDESNNGGSGIGQQGGQAGRRRNLRYLFGYLPGGERDQHTPALGNGTAPVNNYAMSPLRSPHLQATDRPQVSVTSGTNAGARAYQPTFPPNAPTSSPEGQSPLLYGFPNGSLPDYRPTPPTVPRSPSTHIPTTPASNPSSPPSFLSGPRTYQATAPPFPLPYHSTSPVYGPPSRPSRPANPPTYQPTGPARGNGNMRGNTFLNRPGSASPGNLGRGGQPEPLNGRPAARASARPPRRPATRAMPPELTNRQISAEVRARMEEEEAHAG